MTEPWYIKSFQEDYLKIYAHRTDEAAQLEVNQIVKVLDMQAGHHVLDLCCGNGRHSRQLAQLGFHVTGIDLSDVLLQDAQKGNNEHHIRYIQSDVRHIPFEAEFDVVLNLFTSFGYFEESGENQKVFQSIHRALKDGGQFLIDFLNPQYIKDHLVPSSERKVGDLLIKETRRIDDSTVSKQIEVIEGQKTRVYEENVQLFEYPEMENMLRQAGLSVRDVYGNFDLEPYDRIKSPRMVIVGRK